MCNIIIIIRPDLRVFLAGIPIGKMLENPLTRYHFIILSFILRLYRCTGMNEVRAPPSSCRSCRSGTLGVTEYIVLLENLKPKIIRYIIISYELHNIVPKQFQRFSDVILPLKVILNI